MTNYLFIVGAGRSGTKFLMNILNNSEFVHLAPEIHFFSSLAHNGFRKNLRKQFGNKHQYPVAEIIQCLQAGGHFGTYWRRHVSFINQDVQRRLSKEKIEEKDIYTFLVEHDYRRRANGRVDIKYIGEKGGLNIFHIDELLMWYPDAIIFFMYRNPVSVLKSEVNKDLKPDYPLSKSNPLYPYGLAIYVFFLWLFAALAALFYRAKHRENIYLISYEYMADHLEEVIRAVTTVLNVPYSKDLCDVDREDSSFANNDPTHWWSPPTWIVIIYKVFLNPIKKMIDNRAFHNTLN